MRTTFWCALALLTSCQPEAGDSLKSTWDGFADTVGSAVVVHNGALPLVPTRDATVHYLWTGPHGALDPAGAVWEEPSRVRISASAIYVLDPRAGQVISLSWTGLELRRIGRLGGAPHEFQRPADIILMDPFLAVVDAGSIKRFDSGGRYRDIVRIPTLMPYRASRFGVGQYLVGSPSGWHLFTDGALSLLMPPFPSSPLLPDWSGRDCSQVSSAERAVLRLNCVQPVVQMLDSVGELHREFGFDRAAEPATQANLDSAELFFRRQAIRSGMPPDIARALAAFRRERSSLKPKFRAVRAGTTVVAIWEQEPLEFGDGPAVLHVFSSGGVYLAALTFEDAWVDFDLVGWRVVALVRDRETGLVAASAYEIRLPDATLFLADSLLAARAAVP